ncbi:MAG: AI-2E family transporter [Aggregatilineales bacterium]
MTARQTFQNTLVVLATLAGAYIALMSIEILVVVLISIIAASALRPMVLWLKLRGISKGLAILIVYAVTILLIIGLFLIVIPPAATQLATYIEDGNRLANRLIAAQAWLDRTVFQITGTNVQLADPDTIRLGVTNLVNDLRKTFPSFAAELGSILGYTVLAIVVGIYWLTSRDNAVAFVKSLFPISRRARIETIMNEIEFSLGAYLNGIMVVAIFVGVAHFIILSLLGVSNAVTLAFVVGITSIIPMIGGFLGAGGAVLLALLVSPVQAVVTFIVFVAVQQVEAHILTPRIMSRSVNLNPILVIVFLFIGFTIGGVIGALLSVPLAGVAMILARYVIIEPMQDNAQPHYVGGGVLIAPTRGEVVANTAPASTDVTPSES